MSIFGSTAVSCQPWEGMQNLIDLPPATGYNTKASRLLTKHPVWFQVGVLLLAQTEMVIDSVGLG